MYAKVQNNFQMTNFFAKNEKKIGCDLHIPKNNCNFALAKSGCSTVGSVPGLGPGGRTFESCHPDDF